MCSAYGCVGICVMHTRWGWCGLHMEELCKGKSFLEVCTGTVCCTGVCGQCLYKRWELCVCASYVLCVCRSYVF